MAGDTPFSTRSNPASHCVGLYGKKQGIEPGFPLNESQIKILNGSLRLDVATTPSSVVAYNLYRSAIGSPPNYFDSRMTRPSSFCVGRVSCG
jgi:hypothetical protein